MIVVLPYAVVALVVISALFGRDAVKNIFGAICFVILIAMLLN